YVLRYTVRDALDRTAGGPRLAWTAVGDHWDVPIGAVTVTVTGPAAAGGAEARTDGGAAAFRHGRLPGGRAMTVTVGFPAGSVAVAGPVLVDQAWLRWLRSIPDRF